MYICIYISVASQIHILRVIPVCVLCIYIYKSDCIISLFGRWLKRLAFFGRNAAIVLQGPFLQVERTFDSPFTGRRPSVHLKGCNSSDFETPW